MMSTRDRRELVAALQSIDGRGYTAYALLAGTWDFGDFRLVVDHVQSDPFAAPSRVRALIDAETADFPTSAFRTPPRAEGTACFLAHALSAHARRLSQPRGTGRSGEIRVTHPGQLVLPQTATHVFDDGSIEARFSVGLPARGRRVDTAQAIELLLDDVPAAVRAGLMARALAPDVVEAHAATNEDAAALRAGLDDAGLVAFVGDGARLPRRSGIDERPLDPEDVVPFVAPDAMRVAFDLPNAGRVTGMGIPEGVTLIVGGGFHGKSTLLRALQHGVWNHPPGDGRELVVTRADAVKIRAEDGRSVAGVDISPFIDGLPLGRDTTAFTTANASGSTSQAAAIVESLEAGSRLLLVDEDTSATNFMIRDRRMQALVPADGEPITPFVDRVRALSTEHGVSTVLVLGGSGDYLDVADAVVRMADYLPADVTEEAKLIAERLPTGRAPDREGEVALPSPRRLDPARLDPSRGRRARALKAPDDRTLVFGTEPIDLAAVEQLVLRGQIRAVGEALAWLATKSPRGHRSIPELLDEVEDLLAREGLDGPTDRLVGDLVAFRRHELAAALNRLRSLRVE